jgi:cytochrome c
MNKLLISLLLLSGACHANGLSAADQAAAMALAKDSGCLSCHAMNEKVVGPAFSAVAEKYKGEAGAAASLVQSIQNGSKGKWGRIPMPPHSSVSKEDLTKLANWVLTIPKQ